jgi:hypothetical protein
MRFYLLNDLMGHMSSHWRFTFHMGVFTWAFHMGVSHGSFTWAFHMGVSHGHHHAHICGFGPWGYASGVAIEPVVQQLRCNCRLHWLGSVEIDGIIATKHGLSAEAG